MTKTVLYESPQLKPRDGEAIVISTCGHNCGGRCVVNAHVKDDRIVHISTDPRPWNPEHPPLAACARGVGQIERTYHPDRLQYPLRRTGPRGSGQFERISWDEALDEVARQLLRVREKYGNAAILDLGRSGSLSMLHGWAAAKRFLYKFGGCTDLWSNLSAEAEIFALRMTYGTQALSKVSGREPTDYVNSKLIVMWGWSPLDGTFGTATPQYLKHAKQNGTRIICVDPRRTRSSVALADEHIFIRPSTDAAALIAMAQVIVSEGLHDQDYCDRFVLGLDEEHLPPGAPAGASYAFLPDGPERRGPENSGMGGGHHRHSGRDDPPAGDRDRDHQAHRPAWRLRAGADRLRRAVPSRALCACGAHRQCRHPGRQFGWQQRRHRQQRHQKPADRHQPDRRARLLAAARRSVGARQERAVIRPTSS